MLFRSIRAEDSNLTFSFSADSSGALAALGIATFFSGSDAESMKVNGLVSDNLDYIAGAQTANAGDNTNALRMLDLRDGKVMAGGTQTFDEFYKGLVGKLGTDSAKFQNLADNQQALTDQMTNERKAISGVNIDEEAIKLIEHQHAFQAAAKFLATISQMMDVLMNI